MSKTAIEILEQFRKLSLPEKREAIVKESILGERETAARYRPLNEVLGKFKPVPEPAIKDHNYWFAEAILASKRGANEAWRLFSSTHPDFNGALDQTDPFHTEAARCFRQAQTENWRLVTTNYVVHESWALIQNRLGWDGVEAFLDGLLPLCAITWIDELAYEAAAARCRRERRRLLSLTDCSLRKNSGSAAGKRAGWIFRPASLQRSV